MIRLPLRALLLIALALAVLVADGCVRRGEHTQDQPGLTYIVQPGDTLLSISARYDVEIHDIVVANHLRDRDLEPGQRLLLPGVTEYVATTPPPATTAGPPPPPPADVSWYLPRSSWAVQPIDTSNIDPMTHIYRITVHHSGEEGDVIEDPIEAMRHFERIHKNAKGWACIGYHFVIARDGRVFEGRPLKYQGAHAVGDNNIGNIGICLIGDFDKGPVPPMQRAALIATLDRLTAQYGIERSQIFGHREFKATDCPGRYLMAIVEEYRGSGSGQVGPPDPWVNRAPAKPATPTKKKRSTR